MRKLVIFLLAVTLVSTSYATIIIDFTNTPGLPLGPSMYSQAGPMQTIIVPNVAQITGGVVLGNPRGFPQASHASLPNLYGTSSAEDISLQPTITIQINPALAATQVNGTLFNGYSHTISYLVKAYSGNSVVDSKTLNLIPYDATGFRYFSVNGMNITKVTLTGNYMGWWNFLIDDIQIIPEPCGMFLFGAGILIIRKTGRYL